MTAHAAHADRLRAVQDGFRTLPGRYLGADPGFKATFRIVLGDIGHVWEVRCDEHTARVHRGAGGRPADVVIGTDATTWLALRCGELAGTEAYGQRRLYARGNLDLAVAFEGLFSLEGGREPLLRMHHVHLPDGRRISTLTTGRGPDVLFVHGLGGAKSSFLDIAAILARTYRVHALDLPGFGSSSKPATAPYDARWFAETVGATMDALGIERAHVAGNSLGGRVAIELGLREPERVAGLALLCPAVAFVKRSYHPLVRVLRPEVGLLPHQFTRAMIEAGSGRCSPIATTSTLRWPTPSSTSSGAPTRAPARASRSSPRPATSTSTTRSAAAASTRGWRARGALAVRLGHARRGHPAGLHATTSSAGCRAPSRSCSRTAATSRRSSTPSSRANCCRTSSRASTPRAQPGTAAQDAA